MAEKVIPIGSKVLVKQVKAAETYGNTGIYIPETAQSQQLKAYVISVGDAVKGIKDGDYIQYAEQAVPVPMMHHGEVHLLIEQFDILAIIMNV